jgi:hypothetical protein
MQGKFHMISCLAVGCLADADPSSRMSNSPSTFVDVSGHVYIAF